MARILLVVEDEVDLNELIARQLRQDGHEVVQAFDGQAKVAVDRDAPDLVVLDWMLPKLDGLVVCRRIRERHVVPVIMLTARGEEADIILGLEVGADDYIDETVPDTRVAGSRPRNPAASRANWVQSNRAKLGHDRSRVAGGPSRDAIRLSRIRRTPSSPQRSLTCSRFSPRTPAARSAATSCWSASGATMSM